jgi:hypothetical protein
MFIPNEIQVTTIGHEPCIVISLPCSLVVSSLLVYQMLPFANTIMIISSNWLKIDISRTNYLE